MENTLLMIVVYVVMATIHLYIGYILGVQKSSKSTESSKSKGYINAIYGKLGGQCSSLEKSMHDQIESVKFEKELNPLVREIYLLFVSKNSAKEFEELHYRIYVRRLGVSFWSANSVYDRALRDIPNEALTKYDKTYKDLSILSLADKIILDKIARAVKVNNKEFIDRLFIDKDIDYGTK